MRKPKVYGTVLVASMLALWVLAACGIPGVAGSGTTGPAHDETGYRLSDGPPAPDWVLETLDKDVFQLADHQGKVVVMFFMASWCTSCVIEAQALAQLSDTYADQGLVVVAINVEPQKNYEGLTQFRRIAGDASYVWAFDDQFVVSKRYGVNALDTTIIIDRGGRIAYTDAFITPFDVLEAEVRKWL